jgi:antitoxin component YwqK of YwqJK toxin-antitoxin module
MKVLDMNLDGIGDIWSYYGDDGKLTEEHFDMDFDQIPERKEYYQGGELISSIIDKDGNQIPEITRQIRNGVLYRLKTDTTGDMSQDLWQALDKNGKVDKYVRDIDGDGVMDIREE